ncbi:acetylcholine receptor subunit alpha-like 2 [Octopus bimaculoides]|nr:acetylcholine receptor subunit alpha-like 2 [Octopus bimaculoides]
MYKDELRLKDKLLSNYTKHIRPVVNLTASVDINAELWLELLYGLDYVKNILVGQYWIQFQWTDEFLRWNPLNYNNITRIYLPINKVWTPSITMLNTLMETQSKNNFLEMTVDFNGSVTMVEIKLLQTFCEIYVYNYPFDAQTCVISMGIPSHKFQDTKIKELSCYRKSDISDSEWGISFSCNVHGTNNSFSYASATLYLHHQIKMGTIAMLIPTIMMTILTISIFLLPPESGEKVSLAMTIFLSNVLYFLQIHNGLPKNSNQFSLLTFYLMILSLLSGIATLGSVIITRLYVNQLVDNNKLNPSHQSKTSLKNINQIADISTVSKEEFNPVPKADISRKGMKKGIFHYSRLDGIFLKIMILTSAIVCIFFMILS